MFEFKILHRQKKTLARTGEFYTPHGILKTPELAIVATNGEIKGVPELLLPSTPIQYIIVNTFHIYTKHILEKIEEKGGIHNYSGYKKIAASDSGGFQVFSLGFGKSHGVGKIGGMFPGKDVKESDQENPLIITDDGVTFRFNDQPIVLNPEISMDIQHRIGADIMFAFDECTSPLNTKVYHANSLKRTHDWLLRSIAAHKDHTDKQALFAIVQGAYYEDLRYEASNFLAKQDVPGFGIGGTLGKTKADMLRVLEWSIPYLPEEKPKHLLGIGQVWDIFEGVERGVDLFDCVIPTREARHKVVYTKKGKINIRKMKSVEEIIEPDCQCDGCKKGITYAELARLFSIRDPKAFFYATIHNIYFFTNLMKEIREAIAENRFFELKQQYYQYYLKTEFRE